MKKVEKDLERYLMLYKIFNDLPENTLIVLEGKTDKEMITKFILDKLDDKHIKITTLPEFKRFTGEIGKYRNILILTDFDDEGERLEKSIKSRLVNIGGFRILEWERNRIRRLTRSYGDEIYSIFKSLIKTIELYSYDNLRTIVEENWKRGE